MKRCFVLLHDNVDGPANFNEQYVTNEFHKTFSGQLFRIIRLNSVPKSSVIKVQQPADLWVSDACMEKSFNSSKESNEIDVRLCLNILIMMYCNKKSIAQSFYILGQGKRKLPLI